jgi:capsid portal protein
MKDNVLFKKLVEINGYTPKKFFERLIRDYEITGNCYVYIVRNVGGNQTIGLQPLDPRYMKPITDTK